MVAALVVFLVSSTGFLPRTCVMLAEQKHKILVIDSSLSTNRSVFVHVLGAGYSSNPDLPATAKLALPTLGRLVEGVRICRQIPESKLVCSGNAADGIETQASVVRRAAIALDFDSTRLRTLDNPSTTQQEAAAHAAVFGTNHTVIVVTDAMHMSRALYLFEKYGLNSIAAPTNFVTKKPTIYRLSDWIPSTKNIQLTDRLIHELLGRLQAEIVTIK